MTFLKSLWADLVEKRLWPIAVVLLVALVAVPVFLGSGGEDPFDAAALGATGATGGLGAQAQVSLDEPGATRRDRAGRLRDPFKQKRGPATGTSGATATPGSSAPGSVVTPSAAPKKAEPSGPTTSRDPGPRDGGETPEPEALPRVPGLSDYVTEIRLGRPGVTRTPRTVARLTPMPSTEQPSFVYLGVLADRRTAVFLLSSDVRTGGQAKCRPDKSICETIELRAGQTAKLEVTGEDDAITHYTLTVDDVRRRASAPEATTETKTASKKDAEDEGLATDRYAYDDRTGLLRRVHASRTAKRGGRLPEAQARSPIRRAEGAISWGSVPPNGER